MRLSLDRSWRFHLGDIATPLANTHLAAYMNNKAGYARGPAKTNYDDSDWRTVQLPHDWSVEGEFSPENHMDAGYLPRGVAWYRKYLRLDESDRGKHLTLNFDGVATHCTVYVNGHLLHRNFCGYTPFTVDISDVATFGDALNTIAVKVDANWVEGWWYEGAGIYRGVTLTIRERDHIEDVFVTADASGTVRIKTSVSQAGSVSHSVFDRDGQRVGHTAEQTLHLNGPRLWSPDDPYLYTLRTELIVDGRVVDEVNTRFGFRTLRFEADRGFYLNDQHTFLKGVCLHQDHAGVGVAVPQSIERFRLLQMKSIGVNAIRCAHNPPSRTFLDLCDELGLLVMNEVRNFGSSPEHLRQLEAVVKRDRNHPSIILWSVCNEEAIQGSPVAANIARAMIEHLRALDPTRPITGAVSGALLDDVGLSADVFDVISINYNLPLHDAYHAKHPHVPMIVSETGCTYATRGVENTDSDRHHFAEDDSAFAPWGATARTTWEHIRARPYLAGMFVWTGIDYRGEPTPHEWPSVQSHWGLFDLCAFPKRAARLHQAYFTGEPEKPAPPRAEKLTIELPEAMRDGPIVSDGRFTLPITIASPCEEPIELEIAGPARIIGVGNGDPTSHVNKASLITPFNGLAQVLIQTTTEPGPILLTAQSSSGARAHLELTSRPPHRAEPTAAVVFPRHLVTGWRMGPITKELPDPSLMVSDQDMNTWERIDPTRGPQSAWTRAGGVALYRARLTLPKSMQASGCTIRFHRVLGELEAFVDGVSLPVSSAGGATRDVWCTPSAGSRALTLRLASPQGVAGLAASVELLVPASPLHNVFS